MAQQDAMEQVKEVVRQLIKYRFWIAISAAALFGLVAYFMGAGPVQEEAKKETANIKKAETDVKAYTTGDTPTKDYAPAVEEKTGILSKDVNTAWKTLYDRQAPLLTWPETVEARFQKWGREWPKDEDAGKVTLAQVDYIAAYKDYVDMVYKTFKPFDYETGEGIVVAPPKEVLLRPAVFSEEHLPGLGKIWSAQERLWIQRTLLEVVAQVNENAKNWNSAIVRQIQKIEVGNPDAQDQHSLAKNEQLEPAKSILAPGETEEAPEAASAGGGMSPMGGKMGGGAMMGGGGAKEDAESVYYVKAGNEAQYRILPVQMTVLIDQDHVQDLLVELENSPMSIEVKDFELVRPAARVTKPEKGISPMGGYGGQGMDMAMMGGPMRGRRGMTGFGGMMGQMQSAMMTSRMMMPSMGGAMAGQGRPGADERKGKDNRTADSKARRAAEAEKLKQVKSPSLFDPYFDIVEVTVYGQARFFKPPPAEPAAEPSLGGTTAAATAAATPNATPADAKGAAPGDTKGAAPTDAKGAAPANTKGAAPADAKGAAPTDAKGAAPANTKGAAPADAKGAAPTDAKGAAPANTKGAAPADTKGAPPAASKGAAPTDTKGASPGAPAPPNGGATTPGAGAAGKAQPGSAEPTKAAPAPGSGASKETRPKAQYR